MNQSPLTTVHRFLDESGDTTFYAKGKVPIVGQRGVSLAFMLGMVALTEDPNELRKALTELAKEVEQDAFVNKIASVKKRVAQGGFYFHATDDAPEVREKMFKFLAGRRLSADIIVGRKASARFARKHNNSEAEFYADLLGHLLEGQLNLGKRVLLTIARRGNSTKNANLLRALEKAEVHLRRKDAQAVVTSELAFRPSDPLHEPLLWLPDYLCWAVQRVLERGEMRYYDFIGAKIAAVTDLYAPENEEGGGTCYGPSRPLTEQNKLSMPSP
jgi:hypothetical protein